MSTLLADTNVWLRSVDLASPQHQIARDSLKLAFTKGKLVLAPQNLVEFWAVATRPKDANGFGWTTADASRRILKLRSQYQLLTESAALFETWFDLVQVHAITGKRTHDARLAAAVLTNNLHALITFNLADFGGLPIRTLAPQQVAQFLSSDSNS